MKDQDKSKEQLVNELTYLRYRVSELEESEARVKETERLLRESEERYRSLVENIGIGISSIDSDHNIIMSNATISKWYDKPASELSGKKCYRMFRGRQSVCQDCHGVQSMTTGKAAESESDGLKADGSRRNVRVQCFPTVGPDGVPIGFVEVVEDITDRKKVDDELRESERKYRDLFDGAPVGIFQSTIDGRVLSVNPAYAHMYGYASAEQAAREIDNVAERTYVEPKRRNKLVDLALRTDSFVKAENQYRRKDGSLFWGQLYFRVARDRDGEVKHLEGFVEDITDRKMAEVRLRKREAELRASHAQFEAFMDNSPIIAFMRDDQGRYVYVNRRFLSNNNLTSSQVLGKTAEEIFPKEMAHKVTKEDLSVVESKTTIASVESFVDHTGDQREWWLIRFPVRDADGLRYLGGVGMDVTERKREEDELRKQKEILQKIFDHLPVMINFIGEDGRFRLVNRKWERTLGWSVEEIQRQDLDILAECYPDPEYRQQVLNFIAASSAEWADFKTRVRDRRIIDATWAYIHLSDGTVIGIGQDITERKRAEEQIKKSLEEKDLLLREINHRVKNNLQVMSSLVRLQARQVTAENCSHALHETQNRLQTIGLIHEMLHQSRNLAYIDVEGYLKRLIANLFSLYGAKSSQVEITIDAQELRLGVDMADPLGLIANELVSNCLKYAFPGGRNGIIRISLAAESNELRFMVSDNGVGLPEDFDPFTAQTLGLNLVNTLVKQLRGEMTIKRTAGTEFSVKFPIRTP